MLFYFGKFDLKLLNSFTTTKFEFFILFYSICEVLM